MLESLCPAGDTLREFAVGKLGGRQWETLAGHVERCMSCQRQLENIEDAADELVGRLQNLPNPQEAEAAGTEPWVSAVLAAGGTGAPHDRHMVTDAGRDLARRLAEGPVFIDRFELQAELGSGTFGSVFRAWDPRHQRLVALKVQRAGSFATREDTQRFLLEAKSASSLQHRTIVSVYDAGQTCDGVGYLVCEFVDGITLEERLSGQNLAPLEAVEIAFELADALAYAHEHGVIHRDIKPSNIILDRNGRPHLMDFGLAKHQYGEATMTSDGRVMGTPAYMSPEQARGASHQIDARTDVYSLGVVLYEMLVGQRPFQGDRSALLAQVREVDPPRPRSIRSSIPRDLEVICAKAMHKAPGHRYSSARDFAGDLRRYSQGLPILARPMGHLERTLRWCRRYPLAVSVLASVLLGSVAGLAYLSRLSEYFVRETALEGARLETKMLDEVWRFYSEEIADLDPKTTNIAITEAYRTVHPSLPLPASFAIDLGERISHRSPGMEVRVFSRYPWPGRKKGGPVDAFDAAALTWLEANARPGSDPPAEFTHFVTESGQRKLLYFTARHMEQSCLGCHNHPEGPSPKKDWKLGDVVGVLKIVRPLDREIESTRAGLRGAFVQMAAVASLLVAASIGVMVVAQRRQRKAIAP